MEGLHYETPENRGGDNVIDMLALLWFIVSIFSVIYSWNETQTMSRIKEMQEELDKIYEVLAK
ncbi:MAG: hypothetical protein QXZ17_09235 [Nitrososphaerota archaeon]